MSEPRKIGVLLVDDHPVVRLGLRALLDGEADLEVVGEAGDGPGALERYQALRPDVVLMDLRLPGVDGPESIAAIRRHDPEAKIIVITTYDGDEDVFRAVQAGARGYLLKGTFPEGMLEAIRHVHRGGTLFPPEVTRKLEERAQTRALSGREIEVLSLVARGLSNKEIAAVLFVADDTVKNHLKRIYDKLGVADRTEAAFVAVQRGIIRF